MVGRRANARRSSTLRESSKCSERRACRTDAPAAQHAKLPQAKTRQGRGPGRGVAADLGGPSASRLSDGDGAVEAGGNGGGRPGGRTPRSPCGDGLGAF